jgi:hypothetical protein
MPNPENEKKKGDSVGDDDDWEVVDELLIHVDLAGIIQGSLTTDGQQLNTKFIGLETERPIVQIGSQVCCVLKSHIVITVMQVSSFIHIDVSVY